MNVSVLQGKTLTEIKGGIGDSELIFVCSDGSKYRMYHGEDCCETVELDEVVGDIEDLIGSPLLLAEEVSNADDPGPKNPEWDESYTWTFYKFSTAKGDVTLRWYGTSNGFYSEDVDFEEVK